MDFKDSLKNLRTECRLTQRALAEMWGIPLRSVENWETGTRTPPEYVQKLIISELKREREKRENG